MLVLDVGHVRSCPTVPSPAAGETRHGRDESSDEASSDDNDDDSDDDYDDNVDNDDNDDDNDDDDKAGGDEMMAGGADVAAATAAVAATTSADPGDVPSHRAEPIWGLGFVAVVLIVAAAQIGHHDHTVQALTTELAELTS